MEVARRYIGDTWDLENLPIKKRGRIKETLIDDLEKLLKHKEMTDTLRAKIYFQLIRLNIELAHITGQRIYLEKAKIYCLSLTTDHTLSSMGKAEEAARIHTQIKKITDTPVYDFKIHLKKSFDAGKLATKKLFKYLGIIVGNAVDLGGFFVPKLFGKENYSFHRDNQYVHSGKTLSQEFFKNYGFVALFKYIGKRLGEHIIGNIAGGPIGAILGAAIYPFAYLYHKYKSDQTIKDGAKAVIDLEKGRLAEGENLQAAMQATDQVAQSPVKIFAHKNKNHIYRSITGTGTRETVAQELAQSVPVYHEPLSSPPGKQGAGKYAYGSLFASVKQAASISSGSNGNQYMPTASQSEATLQS